MTTPTPHEQLATLAGYRGALQQTAENLRGQAKAWRAEARRSLAELGPAQPVRWAKRRLVVAETDRWCERIERIAQAVDQQAAQVARDEAAQRRAHESAAASSVPPAPPAAPRTWLARFLRP